ncbi:hypothetical protein MKZ38_000878 [Zalerion maritima]|uniref:ABM domain-containing protein n=1 Tax=Zalerion maritima TaxID=339359 RepID=A0AAD5WX48_9PEZI|nr:hypothetical protein MKZ38_000878 [Zalerion maritima]
MDDFYLLANVNFLPGQYDTWQACYDELAEYVWEKEPSTLAYYFGIPIDYEKNHSETTMMFAFEAYTNRDGLYETHLESPAMSKFLANALPTMATGLDLMHYSLSSGFLAPPSRPEPEPCGIMHDTRILATSPASRDVLLSRLAAIAKVVEKDDGKTGVLTYMVFKGLDDDTECRIFARYKGQTEMRAHEARKEMVGFWEMSREKETKKMEQRGYVENGKGWLKR